MFGLESLLVGRTLADRYRIEEVVGRGRTGPVFRAVDVRLGFDVAVKAVTSGAQTSEAIEAFRSRFRQAAGAAALVHHPNVAAVYDCGTDPSINLDFLVMEMLRGEHLGSRLAQRGRPPVPLGLRMLLEAVHGLAAVHAAGVAHGDLRPENLFLTRSEDGKQVRVRLLAFGVAPLAAASGGAVPPLQATGAAAYVAPEQLRAGAEPRAASDVFSLGAVGFLILTGTAPFSDAAILAMAAGQRVAIRSPRELNPDIPPELAAVILRAISADPAARFADATQLLQALAPLVAGLPMAPARQAAAEAPAPSPAPAAAQVPAPAATIPVPAIFPPPAQPPAPAAAPSVAAASAPKPADVAPPAASAPAPAAASVEPSPAPAPQPVAAVPQTPAAVEPAPAAAPSIAPAAAVEAVSPSPTQAPAVDTPAPAQEAPAPTAQPAAAPPAPIAEPAPAAPQAQAPAPAELAQPVAMDDFARRDADPAPQPKAEAAKPVADALSPEDPGFVRRPEPPTPMWQDPWEQPQAGKPRLAARPAAQTVAAPTPAQPTPAAPAPSTPVMAPAALAVAAAPAAVAPPPAAVAAPPAPQPVQPVAEPVAPVAEAPAVVAPEPVAPAPIVVEAPAAAPAPIAVETPAAIAEPVAPAAAAAAAMPEEPAVLAPPPSMESPSVAPRRMRLAGASGAKSGKGRIAGLAVLGLVVLGGVAWMVGGARAAEALRGKAAQAAPAAAGVSPTAPASSPSAAPAPAGEPAAPAAGQPLAAAPQQVAATGAAPLTPAQRRDSLARARQAQQLAQQQALAAQAAGKPPQVLPGQAQPAAAAPQPVQQVAAATPPPAPAPVTQAAPPAPAPAPAAAQPQAAASAPADANAVEEPPVLNNAGEVQRAVVRNYPALLRDAGVSGRARVRYVVREDGTVDPASVSVLDASRDAFGDAAKRALRSARYRPARVNGRPVRVTVTTSFAWAPEGQ